MDPLERYRADVARLTPGGAPPGRALALAVSGGPDSMAMLRLSVDALPHPVIAATVDHGLRPGAAAEAELVAGACADLGIAHTTLRPARAISGRNLHAAARTVRYALLRDWAIGADAFALATAHHVDDQAETFLMRAVRGSGPAGLAGVRESRRDGGLAVIRPLLGWRRAELAELVARTGTPSAIDPSNADERFERTRVRRMLKDVPWLDAAGLANAARHMGEAEEALSGMAESLWRSRAGTDRGDRVVDVRDLPREMRRRLARKAVAELSAPAEVGAGIEPLLDALEDGRPATQGRVLARPDGQVWRFSDAPPRRPVG